MKATIVGASGLVGSNILKQLIDDPSFSQVQVLVRKLQPLQHTKLTQVIVDFENESQFQNSILEGSVVFSCIGTTAKKVNGDHHQYRKIDFDITVNAAKYAHQKHCTHFIFISAIGADKHSSNSYLKLKGEIESNIMSQHLPRVFAIRPSLLIGARNEFRLGEKIGQLIMPLFNFLIPYRYKAIRAEDVAKKMVSLSHSTSLGFQVIEGKSLFQIEHV
jgi:uncharacterized protein YbjT (DUF2867 family)